MHRTRTRRSLLAVLVSGLAAFTAPPAAGATHTLSIALSAPAGTSVPQGSAMAVRASATNTGAQPAPVDVVLSVESPSGERVSFAEWMATVPAGGNASQDFSVTPAQWYAAIGTYQVEGSTSVAVQPLPFDVTAPTMVVPVFQDVTATAGLTMTLAAAPCQDYASGAAWGDANGDRSLDLYVPSATGPAHLWINDGHGHFTDQAVDRGADDGASVGVGAVFVDVDNDGDQDLYVLNDGPNRLYRNDGTGHFTDVARALGVADDALSTSAAWADYDGDGRLDLYVSDYRNCLEFQARQDRLYHQEPDGTFSDQTELLPSSSTLGSGFQASWFDADGDGDPDLYLANDYIGWQYRQPNHMWRNDGQGVGGGWTFTDVSDSSGTGYAINSMGVAIADYDHDQRLDFAVSNIAGNVLAHNDGDGTFTDMAGTAGVERPTQELGVNSITWGLSFLDANLDGWEDLYVAAGPIWTTDVLPNQLFVNAGTGTFLDLSAATGAADAGIGRGVALADYDRDGLMDIYVVNQDGTPRLYRNVTPKAGRHWLEVDTVGTSSNRDGCGALVTVVAGGAKLLHQVFCGSTSLSSGSDPTLNVGLGSAPTASRIVVLWPSGTRQVIRNVRADRLVTITEPAN